MKITVPVHFDSMHVDMNNGRVRFCFTNGTAIFMTKDTPDNYCSLGCEQLECLPGAHVIAECDTSMNGLLELCNDYKPYNLSPVDPATVCTSLGIHPYFQQTVRWAQKILTVLSVYGRMEVPITVRMVGDLAQHILCAHHHIKKRDDLVIFTAINALCFSNCVFSHAATIIRSVFKGQSYDPIFSVSVTEKPNSSDVTLSITNNQDDLTLGLFDDEDP